MITMTLIWCGMTLISIRFKLHSLHFNHVPYPSIPSLSKQTSIFHDYVPNILDIFPQPTCIQPFTQLSFALDPL